MGESARTPHVGCAGAIRIIFCLRYIRNGRDNKERTGNNPEKKDKSKPQEEIVDGLVVKKQKLDHGFVRFRVYRPNEERTALQECESIECTQDDFVVFLQTGIVRTNNNKQLNLFV